MTPIELNNLYVAFRQRVAVYSPNACGVISLGLPVAFCDELSFYRLVNWSYVLVTEAAKIPLKFLTNLPPLKADQSFFKEIAFLRTYVAHNLDVSSKNDRKTYAFVFQWFKGACGRSDPITPAHFAECCEQLLRGLEEKLRGGIEACDLLDDSVDGLRLVEDLRNRVELMWDAHRFDPMVARCAERLGRPSLDLRELRNRHIEVWRTTLELADPENREEALEQRVEADVLAAIGDTLPSEVSHTIRELAANRDAVVAGLLLLRSARQIGSMSLQDIVAFLRSAT